MLKSRVVTVSDRYERETDADIQRFLSLRIKVSASTLPDHREKARAILEKLI